MTYSLDFRQKVFEIKEEENLTFDQTSKRFHVSIRSLFSWSKNIEPKKTRNKPSTKIDMNKLKEDVKKFPDDFQYERAERLGVSPNGILYALRRLNVSYKKNSVSSKG